jgi:hypothetical protein
MQRQKVLLDRVTEVSKIIMGIPNMSPIAYLYQRQPVALSKTNNNMCVAIRLKVKEGTKTYSCRYMEKVTQYSVVM